jgi:hypothetical protein
MFGECLACYFTPSKKSDVLDLYEDKLEAAQEYHRWARRARGFFAAASILLPYIGESPEEDVKKEHFTVNDWHALTALVRKQYLSLLREFCLIRRSNREQSRTIFYRARRLFVRTNARAHRRAPRSTFSQSDGGGSGGSSDDDDGNSDSSGDPDLPGPGTRANHLHL